jgi:hypothetical protein
MLHFLATIALCIFVGERVWHYYQIAKYQSRQRRLDAVMARMLETKPRPEPNPAAPRPEPEPWNLVLPTDRLNLSGTTVCYLAAAAFLGSVLIFGH